MTVDTALIDEIAAAVTASNGLRPAAATVGARAGRRLWDTRKYAVDLTPTVLEVQVVATALPLKPLLEQAAAAIRPLISGTRWEQAELRLVVTALEATALPTTGGEPEPRTGP